MTAEERPETRATGDSPDFRAIAKIAQRIRLADVQLRWSQLGRFTEQDEIDPDWARKAFLSFDSHALVSEDEEERENRFLVQCIFQLRYFADLDSASADNAPEATEDNPPDVAIEAIFDLTYGIDDWEETSEGDFQHFALANGTHNAWPYWREFAQSMSLRIGLSPYVVGPFKLPSRDDPQSADDGPPITEPSSDPETTQPN